MPFSTQSTQSSKNPTPNLLSSGFKVGVFQNWRVFQFWDRKFQVQLFEMSTWKARPFLNFFLFDLGMLHPMALGDHPATSNNLWRDWLRLFTKVKSNGVSSRWNLWIFFKFWSCLVTILELSHLGPVLCSKQKLFLNRRIFGRPRGIISMTRHARRYAVNTKHMRLQQPPPWILGGGEKLFQKIYNSTVSKSFLNCPIALYLGHLGV